MSRLFSLIFIIVAMIIAFTTQASKADSAGLDSNPIGLNGVNGSILSDNPVDMKTIMFGDINAKSTEKPNDNKGRTINSNKPKWFVIGEEYGTTLYLDTTRIRRESDKVYASIGYDKNDRIKSKYRSTTMDIRLGCSFGTFARLAWKSFDDKLGQGHEIFYEAPTGVSNEGWRINHGSLEEKLKEYVCKNS